MKFLAAFTLLILAIQSALADEILVPATIIPSSEWVYWQANSAQCSRRTDVPFRMDAIGSKAKFTAHADVCGGFNEAQVLELLRLVKLADVAAKYHGPWRVSIVGHANAVFISFEVINACRGGMDWLIGRRFDRWAIWDPMMTRPPCPVEFQPELLPQAAGHWEQL